MASVCMHNPFYTSEQLKYVAGSIFSFCFSFHQPVLCDSGCWIKKHQRITKQWAVHDAKKNVTKLPSLLLHSQM
jgi:hypothetical protein